MWIRIIYILAEFDYTGQDLKDLLFWEINYYLKFHLTKLLWRYLTNTVTNQSHNDKNSERTKYLGSTKFNIYINTNQFR